MSGEEVRIIGAWLTDDTFQQLTQHRPPWAGGDSRITYQRISSAADAALAGGGAIRILLAEPAALLRGADEAALGILSLRTQLRQLQIKVVARLIPSEVRLAFRVGRRFNADLFLLGFDTPYELFDTPPSAPGRLAHSRSSGVAEAVLPPRVMDALRGALMSPASANVKRVAAESGVSRRTLERLLSRAGLPSPAALLRQARHRG